MAGKRGGLQGMNAGSALKLTCVGIAGGIIFRMASLLFLFDFETGFYKDNGIAAWGIMAFLAVIAGLGIFWCQRDKRAYFGPYETRKNMGGGLVSALSALALFVMFVLQLKTHGALVQVGQVGINYSQSSGLHLLFILSSAVFGVLQLMTAVGFFTGKNLFQKVPTLHLISVVWGILNLLFTFFYYAKSAMHIENVYMIVGAAATVFSLLYMSKLIVGIGGEKTARNCYIFGIPAVLINLTYTVSNLIVNMLGKNYYNFGEIPVTIQLGSLGVSFFILAFLFTFKKYSLKRKPRPEPGSRRQESGRGGRRFHAG